MNAKNEFLKITEGKKVICANIYKFKEFTFILREPEDYEKIILLPKSYTKEEYNTFLEELDFDYNDGYGCQELGGLIWLEDNSWIERYVDCSDEYEGSEWWQVCKIPEIPEELIR